MTPEERAAKREAVIQGMVGRGYTRERAEELIGLITKALFRPAPVVTPSAEGSEGCHADRDGECVWTGCPQLRDGEPVATGRHCPIDIVGVPE